MKALHALTFAALGCMIGCAPVTVSYDYDDEADFARLKQYSWSDIPFKDQADELTVKRFKQTIDRQLRSKGFVRTTAAPDFVIVLRSFTETVRDVVEWGPRYGGYGGYGRYGGYGGYGSYWYNDRVDVYEYERSTFILDLIESTSGELIWRGKATGIVEPELTQEAKSKKTKETVTQLLKNFPPTPKN